MTRSAQSGKQGGQKELDFIENLRLRAGRGSGALRLGIGDDCAILRPSAGQEIAITTDFSLEMRHFRREWHPAESVGHRALARGLSDLAAMGAAPLAAFLSLALPAEALRDGWANQFLAGLLALAEQHRVPLAGGDTSESPDGLVLADIVLVGALPRGRALRRSGAKAGDAIYVTGTLGGAAAELDHLARAPREFARAVASGAHPHLYPQPRIALGRALLRRRLATAAIDISDGLSSDLAHLCEESKVAARIEQAALPVAAGATLQQALHGGDDYELLFTAPEKLRLPRQIGGVRIKRIGKVLPRRKGRPQCALVGEDGRAVELAAQGWEHFQ
jgi:thiamine-monophosphate kinase